MSGGKKIASRNFTGGMDQDSEDHRMDPNDYREARNIEGGYGSIVGAKRVAVGNRLISYTFPPGGDYICVGGVEDKPNNSWIYFVRDNNDPDNGFILEYKAGAIRKLLNANIQSGFNDFIHSSVIVNGCLYWVDGQDYEDGLGAQGSAPKKICLPRFRSGKLLRYELILNEDCLLLGVQWRYSLYTVDGVQTQSPTLFQTNAGTGTLDQIMLALFNNLDSAGFTIEDFPVNTLENPARRIVFYRASNVRVVIEVTGGAGTPEVQLNELNFYPLPNFDRFSAQIRLIKPTPLCPPSVLYTKDTALGISNLQGRSFQFRYRYVFADNEKSAWGPASRIATNFSSLLGETTSPQRNYNDETFNKILITIDDEFTQSPWRWIVRKVELCFRNNRLDPWRSMGTFELYNFFINDITVEFINGNISSVVASDDVAAQDVQALKNYDDVPRIADSIESIYDDNGNAILVLGGGLYDYDLTDQFAEIQVNKITVPVLPTTTETSNNKYLKRGGQYKIGGIFKDDMGRLSSVFPLGDVKIPFLLEDVGDSISAYVLQVNMVSEYPNWVDFWQVVISENLNQEIYWQASCHKVAGYQYDKDTGELIPAAGEWYGFHFNLQDLDSTNTLLTTIFEFTAGQNAVFIPEQGDRIQIYKLGGTYSTSPPVDANIPYYNYPIVGYSFITTAGVTDLVVLIDSSFGDGYQPLWAFYSGILSHNCEIYRPKLVADTNVYYEFGPCQDLTGGFGTIALSGYGDTYLTASEVKSIDTVTTYMDGVERVSLHPGGSIPEWDLGRAVVYDPNYRERNLPQIIRASDPLILGGSSNGLCSFRGANYFTIPDKIGTIKKLVFNQTVLLAVGSLKTQPIYVARDRLLSLSGSSVGRTDQLFNVAEELRFDLGTVNPESILYEDGATYGFHFKNGRFWRYTTGGGQYPISDYKMITPFLSLSQFYTSKPSPAYKAPVGFERRTKQLFVTNFDFTATFQEEDNNPHWVSYYDFEPEYYGRVGPTMLAFKDGQLWVHGTGVSRGKYFDTQTQPSIVAIINEEPFNVKLFDCLEIEATNDMIATEITIPDTPGYGNMFSQLLEGKFRNYEGRQKADFLRDIFDPDPQYALLPINEQATAKLLRARNLRGQTMLIRLATLNNGADCIITGLYVYYVSSNQTVNTQ